MKLINLLLNNKKFKISFLVILDILIILFAYFLMFLFKFYSNEVHIREIVELYFINEVRFLSSRKKKIRKKLAEYISNLCYYNS